MIGMVLIFLIFYKYPFLKNIWTQYEEFDKPVNYDDEQDDDYNNILKYEDTCKVVIRNTNNHNKKYNDFCMKLIRNLGPYSKDKKLYNPSQERCNTLNYWLYYKIVDLKFPENFLKEIFEEANKIATGISNIYVCQYTYNEQIKDPEKIIKLLNFNDNIDKIQKILKGQINNEYCLCEEYINECVKIYKSMKNMYCSGSPVKVTNRDTCSHLDTFDTTYTTFLINEQQLRDGIPSLTSSNNEYIGKCRTTQRIPVLNPSQQDSSDNPKKISVTGTIGTMAGVSSILALLYKVN
ncbi:hypothetical protein PVNG_02138 [Plasmodium vivax North Korean]|uniref:Uncharacterized protein n=1 Tax=Plasmodium vivax North Korean TaxID=1035514 RepID=A0A0J9TTI7_PLAVI|nr:hypothetical protein PVNG_02138 [Plasmodium vivax North Korean]